MSDTVVLKELPELKALGDAKSKRIRKTFEPMAKMLEGFEGRYEEVIKESEKGIDSDLIAKAHRLRLDIAQVRLKTEKVRVEEKKEYLLAGKAIDGVSNILKWAVTEKEDNLKKIEQHFALQEQKRLEELQNDRVALLSPYVDDAADRKLSEMDEQTWDAYLTARKKEYNDKIKAEKEAKEAQAKKDAEAKAERDALQAKAKEEERKRKAAEAALKKKEQEEQKRKDDEAAKIEADLNKGDAAKIKDLVADLENIKTKYTFKSLKNKKMYKDVQGFIDETIAEIQK